MRRAEQVVRDFSPALVKPWAKAQQLLDAAAIARTGRRFSQLSSERQQALLEAWQRDSVLRAPLAAVSLLYKFVHFDEPRVYGALGGVPNRVDRLEQPRWLERVHSAASWDGGDVECDVVVVGTGAGGAVVGKELAERGHAVVFVEEGEHHRRDAFSGSSINAHERFYRGAVAVGNVMMPVFIGRLVGGSTAVNGGTCFRTPDRVLARWCETMGTDDFAPSAMERHFQRVERTIEVTPAAKKQIGPIGDVIADGANALGWSHFTIRRNAPGCDGQGFCDFGCRTDARRSTNLSYVPPALERGAELFTGLRVEEVLLERTGARPSAVGVVGRAANGRTITVRARAVILAGGAVPTPLLLQQLDLANSSGEVGKNLTLHPSAGITAVFDRVIGGPRHIPQGYGVDEFLDEGMLITSANVDVNYAALMLQFAGRQLMDALADWDHVGGFAVLIADGERSRGRVWRSVAGKPAITYHLSNGDRDRLHEGIVRVGRMAQAAGARHLYPAYQNLPSVPAHEIDRLRAEVPAPRDMALVSYHPLGTCRMGRDPKRSVVDLDHETHDVASLFIVDGSVVQGPLGVNPQLTIMAVATRAAERIAEHL